jgi:hypothetical protein
MSPEAKALLNRDLYLYYRIGSYIANALTKYDKIAAEEKAKDSKITAEQSQLAWDKIVKVNALGHGLMYLIRKLSDVCFEDRNETYSPTDEDE